MNLKGGNRTTEGYRFEYQCLAQNGKNPSYGPRDPMDRDRGDQALPLPAVLLQLSNHAARSNTPTIISTTSSESAKVVRKRAKIQNETAIHRLQEIVSLCDRLVGTGDLGDGDFWNHLFLVWGNSAEAGSLAIAIHQRNDDDCPLHHLFLRL